MSSSTRATREQFKRKSWEESSSRKKYVSKGLLRCTYASRLTYACPRGMASDRSLSLVHCTQSVECACSVPFSFSCSVSRAIEKVAFLLSYALRALLVVVLRFLRSASKEVRNILYSVYNVLNFAFICLVVKNQ